ncbi:O-antigen ligase family protein [Rhizobium sp. CG4]|uniref:O-antigen ligase family protein n=1 Tax=Rhizobium sp. CG4 TaxID=2726075 RepID=UPI0020333649|nr:O-antigen ligase family protein [Rhizobium sp. CG4]MCM2458019.1 O-antigen ligase family protein [Rhizobium sp. CG4]
MRRTDVARVSNPPKIGMVHKILLRRRFIDPILLSVLVACFPIKLGIDMVLLAFFIGSGIYLIAVGHGSRRLIDRDYATASLCYASVALLIGVYHGNIAENIRWIGLPLYFAVGVPLFTGFVLIKDPLRQIALGARVGLLLTFCLAIYESLAGISRIGLGGNAANAAFVTCVIAVLARFTAKNSPIYLPNTRAWFYVAIVPVIMTGTRSVLPVFAIAALVDVINLRGELLSEMRKLTRRRLIVLGLTCLTVIIATTYKTSDLLITRFENTIEEMDNLIAAPDGHITGLDMRVALWKGALEIFYEHPILGVGASESMQQIKQGIPASQREIYEEFVHVHFFVLDELRDRGGIGFIFLIGFFAIVFKKAIKGSNKDVQANMIIFLCVLVLYGSLHGMLLGDRNVAAITIVFVGVLATQRRAVCGRRVAKI